MLFGGKKGTEKPEHEYENLNMAREQENKLEQDDLWLCTAWLWLEIVRVVAWYAPGRNLNFCRLPGRQNEQNEQKMNFFGKCQIRSKIAWILS